MLIRLSISSAQCLLILSMLLMVSGSAQDISSSGFYVQTKGGFLMAHRSAMTHLVRQNAYGFEVGVINHKQDELSDAKYHFPAVGFNLEYRNFGYDEVLGQAISTSFFFNKSFYQGHTFFVDFQYGMGLGYLTKKYSIEQNPSNNAIGSHLNAKVTLKLMALKYFSHYSLGAGFELSHFSNGAITYPNLGLNLPSVFLQIGLMNNQRKSYRKDLLYESRIHDVIRKNSLMVSTVFSAKQVRANPKLPRRYPVFGLRGTYQRLFSEHWSFEGSLDLIHNESNLFVYPDSNFTRSDVLQIGLFAGASYRFYKSEIVMGLGYYLRDNINTIGRLYNKIGYRFYLNQYWYGLFNIRANLGKADFFEFGIGYRIKSW
ncbi:MAG: acyloxyacyl hydrolase [Crocinitomicaceae bacterium]